MNCIICGKPVRSGADICSSSCALQAAPKSGKVGEGGENEDDPKKIGKTKSISSLVHSLQESSILESVKVQEVPMILIQHKWMKNRNLLSNRTVLSFDDQGIARVKKIGYAMEDIEAIIKRFPGQISIVNEIKSEPVVEVKIKAEEKPVIAPPQDVKKKKQPVVKQKTEEN